jgi:Protein of unknown function (DUF2917)
MRISYLDTIRRTEDEESDMRCSLGKGELFKLEAASESDLRCLKGLLWITTGDGRDYLLTDNCPLQRLSGKTALIEALEDSELRFECKAGQAVSIISGLQRAAGFMVQA